MPPSSATAILFLISGRLRTEPRMVSGEEFKTAIFLNMNSHDPHAARDKNFQGFGRFLTGSTGDYYFRTIKPVLDPGRTRHVHFALKMKGREKWTTQCYVKGEPQNERDGIYREIKDPKARAAVTVDFAPVAATRIGELAARFDIVPGFTPAAARI